MPTKKQVKKPTKTVKAWGIINTDNEIDEPNILWGIGGVGVAPICTFSSKAEAEFFMNQESHKDEVSRGTTKIVEVSITYSL